MITEPRKMNINNLISIAITIPMANENATAIDFCKEVLDECAKHHFKAFKMFVVLDHVCRDGTIDLLKQAQIPNLEIVWAPENKCIVDAYLRGYKAALEWGADYILEMDAGYSHLPSELHRHLNKIAEGYDAVFGSRFCKGGQIENSPISRRLISHLGTLLSNFILGTHLSDMTSGYELFSRMALEKILARGIQSKTPFFQTEIKAWAHEFKIAEVPITYANANHPVGSSTLKKSLSELWSFRKRYSEEKKFF